MKLYRGSKLTAYAGNTGSRKENGSCGSYATCGILFACIVHLLLETGFWGGLCLLIEAVGILRQQYRSSGQVTSNGDTGLCPRPRLFLQHKSCVTWLGADV